MPRNSAGTFSLVAGNPVVDDTVIEATWANDTLNDLAAEITGSLSRSGKGGMLVPMEFSDGTAADPAITFSAAPTTGLYRAGTNDVRFSLAGVDLVQLAATLIKFIARVTDGASAVGLEIDTVNALTTAGAKILRVLNATVEKFSVDKDGKTNTPALQLAANSHNVEIASPAALAADYELELPDALPAAEKIVTLDAAGKVTADYDVDGSTLEVSSHNLRVKDGGITQAKRVALGQQISSSCGAFTTTSATYVDVTNLSVTITTTGRPVFVGLIPDGDTASLHEYGIGLNGPTVGQQQDRILRDSTEIAAFTSMMTNPKQEGFNQFTIDTPAAGTYTYKVQLKVSSSSDGAAINYAKLIAFEL